jgi:hypothetical protein
MNDYQDASVNNPLNDNFFIFQLMGQELDDRGQTTATGEDCHPFTVLLHYLMDYVKMVLKRLNSLAFQELYPLFLGKICTIFNLPDELPIHRQQFNSFPENVVNFFIIEFKKHAVELFLFFDDLFESIDGLHLGVFILLFVDYFERGAFIHVIRVGQGVERVLLLFLEGNISAHVSTIKGEIIGNVKILHNLLPQSKDSAILGQSDCLLLHIVD